MGDLTGRIVAQATAPPTSEALEIMRLSLVDWMAVGIAGAGEPSSCYVRAMITEEAGAPQASLFGGGKAPARAAALYNGTASHALDYDDTHFAHIGHLSVGILPATLAMAERNGADLDQMLRAALAGCEAAIRMGQALGREHYQVGFHQTATAGAFGATLAASLLDSVDPTVHAHALGLASTRASGLKSQFGTDGKPYNAGIAAANGIECALLAGRGMVSNPDGWDGPGGFLATHHGDGDTGPDGFQMPGVQHKFHACCHGLHAALEALRMLNLSEPQGISRIDIATNPRWLTVCDKPAPCTGLEVKFSYRAVVALALMGHDTAALETYSDRLARDPQMHLIRDKVRVTRDAALPETAARVHVDGQEASFDLATPRPLAARQERVKAKATALLGGETADAIWQAVHQGGALSRLTALMT